MLTSLPRLTPHSRKTSRTLALTGIAALVTACGFVATPPQWKSWASDDTTQNQTDLRSAFDLQGNTWQEFRDAEGTHMRLVDSAGHEQWRQMLPAAADSIVPEPQGAVAVGNGLMTAFDIDGNTRWSQSVPASTNISVDAQSRIVAVTRDNQQITVTGFSATGAQRWQTRFNATEAVNYSLVTTRNDGTSVILYETKSDQPSLASRTVDSNGVLGAERRIAGADFSIGSIPWLETNGNRAMAFSHGTLYAFNDDGSVAWQYAAPAPADNTTAIRHCSKPGVERTVCHRSSNGQTRVEWIDNAGTVVAHQTLAIDSAVTLIGNGVDRWALVEIKAPDEFNNLNALIAKPQYVIRMHTLDNLGTRTGIINLEPAAVYPANCVISACVPMTLKDPGDIYFNGGITANQMVVTGGLVQSGTTYASPYRSFVAAYAIK